VLEPLSRSPLGPLHLGRLEGPQGFQRWAVLRIVDRRHASDPTIQRTFYERARLGASLLHRNVATVFDAGDDGEGTRWTASEYVQGLFVDEIVDRLLVARASVPWDVATRIVADAAEGLAAVHSLKAKGGGAPAWVLGCVSPHRMIVGFDGATKLLGVFEPTVGDDQRRVAYTAPEELFGDPVDGRADVFALGVVLWELCAGRRLFAGATREETCAMIEAHRVPRLGQVVRGVPAPLEEVVRRALASRPDARYPTARDLARALASVFVAERRVVDDEDVGRWMRTTFADLLALDKERLREAADVTEVFRKSRPRGPLDDDSATTAARAAIPRSISEAPTPAVGSPAMDPGSDPFAMTGDMPTQVRRPSQPPPAPDTLPDGGVAAEDAETGPYRAAGPRPSARGQFDSLTDTPPLGGPSAPLPETPAVGVEHLMAQRDRALSAPPQRSKPPPKPEPRPQFFAPPRRSRLDSFDASGESEVFFAQSGVDGPDLVRPAPIARSTSIIVEDEAQQYPQAIPLGQHGSTPPPAGRYDSAPPPSWSPSSAPPPGLPPGHLAMPVLPPATPPPSLLPQTDPNTTRLMMAAIGVGVGVVFFALVVSVASRSQAPAAGSASAAPEATTAPHASVTAPRGTAVAPPSTQVAAPATTAAPPPHPTVAAVPQLPVSALPPTRPPPTARPPAPPPQSPPPVITSGKPGLLTVICRPACDSVVLDGKRALGGTPISKVSVPPGTHRLQLKVDQPATQKTVSVTVTSGETTLVTETMP
jgi:serine/threonine-protein kinase